MKLLNSKVFKAKGNPLERVDEYLRDVYLKADPGGKLPSVRMVMRECKVSQAVVDRALVKLQTEGLVESRPRSGFYRSEKKPAESPVVNLLFFGDPGALKPGGFGNEFLGYLMTKLAERGESIRVRLMRQEKDPVGVIEDILRQRLSVCLMYGVELPYLHLVRELESKGTRCLHLFPNTAELVSPCLSILDEKIVREQVEHLVNLGHRRIGYLHGALENEYLRPMHTRRDIFCRLCMEYNLDVQYDWVTLVEWDNEKVRTEVRRMMTAPRRPTALIIYDDHVNPVYAELRACGLVPGKDVSVVGTDDMSWAAHVEPPLTTVRVPRIRAANAVCEMMEQVLRQEESGIRYLETNLVVRQSTQRNNE
jgi:DNA-binding LacI/PurR family transcriptional regulator